MQTLNKRQRLTLRQIFRAKLPKQRLGKASIMARFDRAVEEFNRLAMAALQHRAVARRCNGCGRLSVKGTYRDGKRRFYCPSCSAGRRESCHDPV